MKHKFLLSLTASALTLALHPAARAQDAAPSPSVSGTTGAMPEKGWHHGGAGGGGGMMLQHLTTELSLTPEQQTSLKPILETSGTSMQALRQDSTLSREDKMAKMKEIRQTANEQINSLLTADQQVKFAALQEKMRNRRHAAAGASPSPDASASPSSSPSATP